MHALQEPLSRQTNKAATLADARSRWERSKEIEGKVMARKHAEKAAELEAIEKERERRKGKSPGEREGPTDLQSAGSRLLLDDKGKEKKRHRRRTSSGGGPTALSMDILSSGAGPSRLPSSAKVEEWQRYQQANGPVRQRDDRGRDRD
jgi:hypothetical protein